MQARFIIAFSGHRKLENEGLTRRALAACLQKLRDDVKAENAVLEVFSSVAYGADVVFAEVAHELGMAVHLISPKPILADLRQGLAADFWQDDVFLSDKWERVEKMIERARAGIHGGSLRMCRGSQTEPDCYYDTAMEMLDACDLLVTWWDGKEARGLGGTAHAVEQAKLLEKPYWHIDSVSGETLHEPASDWCKTDRGLALLRELEEIGNAEGEKYLFVGLEKCATRHALRFRSVMMKTISINALATLIATAILLFPKEWKLQTFTAAMVELVLVAYATRLTGKIKKDKVHERWLKSRFATELVRPMGVDDFLLDPLFPPVRFHFPEWRRFAMSAGLTMRDVKSQQAKDWQIARDLYVKRRLREKKNHEGQISFFSAKQKQAEQQFSKAIKWSQIIGKFSVVFVAASMIYKGLDLTTYIASWKWLDHFHFTKVFLLKFLPVALPLSSGVFLSMRKAHDSGRRTFRYQEIVSRLEHYATLLEGVRTEAAARRYVEEVEEILLDELTEWQVVEKQNTQK